MTNRSIGQEDSFEHRLVGGTQRLSVEVAHDVGTDGRDMTTIFRNLFNLFPVQYVTGCKHTRNTRDLERGIYFDVPVCGQNLFTKRRNVGRVGFTSSRRDL